MSIVENAHAPQTDTSLVGELFIFSKPSAAFSRNQMMILTQDMVGSQSFAAASPEYGVLR